MDISDKRKQLEAVKEARLAKQRASDSGNLDGRARSPSVGTDTQKDSSNRPVITITTKTRPEPSETSNKRRSSLKKASLPSEIKPLRKVRINEVTSEATYSRPDSSVKAANPNSSVSQSGDNNTPLAKQQTRSVSPSSKPLPKKTSPTKGKFTSEEIRVPIITKDEDTKNVNQGTAKKPQDKVNVAGERTSQAQPSTRAPQVQSPLRKAEDAPSPQQIEAPSTKKEASSSSHPDTKVSLATNAKIDPRTSTKGSNYQPASAMMSGPLVQDRVGAVSIIPSEKHIASQSSSGIPMTKNILRPSLQGYDLFHSWGPVSNDDWTPNASALCCFNAKWVFGGESRTILDVTAGRLPYNPKEDEGNRSDMREDNTAVCVVASYSSAVRDIFGGNGATENSMETGVSDITDMFDSNNIQSQTEAGLTDYGYNWGSYNTNTGAFRNIAGSLTSREWSIERVLSMSKAAPGLVMAWISIPAIDHPDEEVEGTVASKMIVAVIPLVCDSEVTSLQIHPFRPNVIFGGTRCGRIVSWTIGTDILSLDTKQLKSQAVATSGTKHILLSFPKRPSSSSFPSPQSHQSPVLRVAVLGDANNHHLYSISQDGKVCTWPAFRPLQPTTSRTAYIGHKTLGNVGSCATFFTMKGADAMSKVIIGTCAGALLSGTNRDARVVEMNYMSSDHGGGTVKVSLNSNHNGSNSGSNSVGRNSPSSSAAWGKFGEAPSMSIHSEESSKPNLFSSSVTNMAQHGGIMTAVAVQSHAFGLRESECVLSAASDGSCIAWFGDNAVRLEGFGDVVCALQWSPSLPTLFAAGDALGTLTLWDVAQSITTPLVSLSLTYHTSMYTRPTPVSTVMGIRKGVMKVDETNDDAEDTFQSATNGKAEINDEISPRITSLHFSSNGKYLFVGTAAGFVYTVELSRQLYEN